MRQTPTTSEADGMSVSHLSCDQNGAVHIVVIGAGEVGSYLAERLSREGHDVAMVEQDADRLEQLTRRVDVLGVRGGGASPSVLKDARIDRCDLIVAVTNIDETNMLACKLGKLLGVETAVARIENAELRAATSKQVREDMGIDLVVDPDAETAEQIFDLLEFPGTAEVAKMAGGDLVVIGARIPDHAPLVGKSLAEIAAEHEPNWDFLFGAIVRGDTTIIPRGDHRIEADDYVRIVCRTKARREILGELGLDRATPKRIMVLGGGRIGQAVAEHVTKRNARVVIVDRDADRVEQLARDVPRALVVRGEITDDELLHQEGVASADAVIALTGEDDANVLACIFAKSAGAVETIAVAHRLELLPLLKQVGIDVALSPRTASANAVMRFVRGGVAVSTALEGDAEVVELEVQEGSTVDGALIAELRLPKEGVVIGGVVRDGKGQIARGRTALRSRDHVIIFGMPDKIQDVAPMFG
ncbi:MAG: Trk system potassium transporter TrkA [Acidimicrobiia bacterium]